MPKNAENALTAHSLGDRTIPRLAEPVQLVFGINPERTGVQGSLQERLVTLGLFVFRDGHALGPHRLDEFAYRKTVEVVAVVTHQCVVVAGARSFRIVTLDGDSWNCGQHAVQIFSRGLATAH